MRPTIKVSRPAFFKGMRETGARRNRDVLRGRGKTAEIDIEDVETAARFCVYGQLGILLDGKIEAGEKAERIRKFFDLCAAGLSGRCKTSLMLL